MKQKKTAREAAFYALLEWKKKGTFLAKTLAAWQKEEKPSQLDFDFAKEVASGVVRNYGFLSGQIPFIAKKAKWNARQMLLVFSALYQIHLMDRIPLYAVVNESVELAKKYCSRPFAKFLNAILRKKEQLQSFDGEDAASLSQAFSFPKAFIEDLLNEYPVEEAKSILKTLNTPPTLTARLRPGRTFETFPSEAIASISEDPRYYIQNPTQAHLFASLTQTLTAPRSILDLCSAPGGKALLAYDAYPQASITCLDLKSKKIRENCKKYGVEAEIWEGDSRFFQSATKFDLVICDLPCSNTGVFAKRPEARWRYETSTLEELSQLQLELLRKGVELTAEGGTLLIMTCSFLRKENTPLVDWAAALKGFEIASPPCYHPPTPEGEEGGFGFSLKRVEAENSTSC